MKFKKGEPRPPNAGRKKGTPNKASADLRAAILAALDAAGGGQYLAEQAQKNPTAFLALLGKTLPKDIKLGGDLAIKVSLVPRKP